MHELSIATSLVDMACETAGAMGGARVEALHLRLGPLAGVVKEALLFSFEVAAQGTAVEGARLEIETTAITALCPACGEERVLPSAQRRRCPVCDTPTPELRGGRELELRALSLWDDAAAHR